MEQPIYHSTSHVTEEEITEVLQKLQSIKGIANTGTLNDYIILQKAFPYSRIMQILRIHKKGIREQVKKEYTNRFHVLVTFCLTVRYRKESHI
jgi:hypothetical protein